MGWNFIRLGVVWAGAQPTPEPELDPKWVSRLQDILELCNKHNIHVILDIHTDGVGSATCGEGVPQWFSALATPDKIGKPLLPLPFTGHLWPEQEDGLCGRDDFENWALHAGEIEYNTKNPCCLRYNQGGNSWDRIAYTWAAQETNNYLFRGEGREYFQRYVGLLAQAVRDYPAAIGIELMNEPMSIDRIAMFRTWEECYDQVQAVLPELAVGIPDVGQYPSPLRNFLLWPSQVAWLKEAQHLFYAVHYYSFPQDAHTAIKWILLTAAGWGGMPVLISEMNSCIIKVLAVQNNISWAYWEYAEYCNTAPTRNCLPGEKCFGACITGNNGNAWKNFTCECNVFPNYTCPSNGTVMWRADPGRARWDGAAVPS